MHLPLSQYSVLAQAFFVQLKPLASHPCVVVASAQTVSFGVQICLTQAPASHDSSLAQGVVCGDQPEPSPKHVLIALLSQSLVLGWQAQSVQVPSDLQYCLFPHGVLTSPEPSGLQASTALPLHLLELGLQTCSLQEPASQN